MVSAGGPALPQATPGGSEPSSSSRRCPPVDDDSDWESTDSEGGSPAKGAAAAAVAVAAAGTAGAAAPPPGRSKGVPGQGRSAHLLPPQRLPEIYDLEASSSDEDDWKQPPPPHPPHTEAAAPAPAPSGARPAHLVQQPEAPLPAAASLSPLRQQHPRQQQPPQHRKRSFDQEGRGAAAAAPGPPNQRQRQAQPAAVTEGQQGSPPLRPDPEAAPVASGGSEQAPADVPPEYQGVADWLQVGTQSAGSADALPALAGPWSAYPSSQPISQWAKARRRPQAMDLLASTGCASQGLGLSRYVPAFVAEEVDLSIVHALTREDLATLGVAHRPHQQALLAAAQRLPLARRGPPAAPPPPQPPPAQQQQRRGQAGGNKPPSQQLLAGWGSLYPEQQAQQAALAPAPAAVAPPPPAAQKPRGRGAHQSLLQVWQANNAAAQQAAGLQAPGGAPASGSSGGLTSQQPGEPGHSGKSQQQAKGALGCEEERWASLACGGTRPTEQDLFARLYPAPSVPAAAAAAAAAPLGQQAAAAAGAGWLQPSSAGAGVAAMRVPACASLWAAAGECRPVAPGMEARLEKRRAEMGLEGAPAEKLARGGTAYRQVGSGRPCGYVLPSHGWPGGTSVPSTYLHMGGSAATRLDSLQVTAWPPCSSRNFTLCLPPGRRRTRAARSKR